ncbi:TRAP transporter substrate-binding protein [Kushneria indalinina]|uniref:TRAP transporter substrate-binding protein n=1 Tax=Kushneria indalinina TaxID=184067 RepID=UPI001FE4E8DD|nr:TRAP transporter substrate-binding protein [Kushneria indalinina]
MSHNLTTDHSVHKAMTMMGERVAELTNGAVRVRIYPGAQLGTQRESVELVQRGILDMAKTNASELEAFDPVYSVLNVPYLFTSRDHFYQTMTGDIGRKIFQASRSRGFEGVTFYDSGARSFYATRPIRTPDDLYNMKVRVQPSATAIAMTQLLRASPTPLSFGELYTALQQGVVDAAENNPTALVTARHGEVARFFTLDEHTRVPDMLVISTATLERLSSAHRDALYQAAHESMIFQKGVWENASEQAVATAKAEMGVEFIDVDQALFADRTRPLRNEIASQSAQSEKVIQDIERLSV